MQIQLFTFCDSAQMAGKCWSVIGATDLIQAAQYPFVIPFSAIAIKLQLAKGEQAGQTLKTAIVDEQGHPIFDNPPYGEMVELHNPSHKFQSINCCFRVDRLTGLKIPKPGQYRLQLFCGDKQIAEAVLLAA